MLRVAEVAPDLGGPLDHLRAGRPAPPSRPMSMEIGKAPMRTIRSSTAIRRSVALRTRAPWWPAGRSCARPAARWKPTRSAPSMPRSSSARRGSCMNSSGGGNGMCRKKPIRRSGRSARSMRRHQLQVVVLDPDHRARLGDFGGRLGEPPVDPLVRLPPAPVVHGLSPPRRDRAARGSSSRSPRSGRGRLVVAVRCASGRRRRRVAWGAGPVPPAQPTQVAGVCPQDGVQGADQATRAAPPLSTPSGATVSSMGRRLATTTMELVASRALRSETISARSTGTS